MLKYMDYFNLTTDQYYNLTVEDYYGLILDANVHPIFYEIVYDSLVIVDNVNLGNTEVIDKIILEQVT